MEEHDVRRDKSYTGLFGVKFVCHTEGCNMATLVHKRNFSDREWKKAIVEFKEKHPSRRFVD